MSRFTSACVALAALLIGAPARAGNDLVIPGFNTGLSVQSYLRISNNDGAPAQVSVRMHDAATGIAIATWTSPVLPPGATMETWAQQMLAAADPKPDMARLPPVLLLSISGLAGHVQHATWTPASGTWSHVSTCGMVLMADPLSLPFVIGPARGGLTGLVRVSNATGETRSLRVTFHDSANNPFVWQSPSVPSYGAVTATMETIARETTPPIPESVVSLMAMADAAPAGVALSYSEGLTGGNTLDDFSAGCMSTIAAPVNPGAPTAPANPMPGMPHA
ncbi:MAG: hypothetical protein IT566_05670 [Rhodospirillaceae bacterium]|nr:hypothetical protein [Rhodospirillaceae bacterium]